MSKKRKFLSSILSMILCLSMLLGTTLAWFSDTASVSGNRIVTGALGIRLNMYDEIEAKYVDISDGSGDIFSINDKGTGKSNGILWEPGKTEVVFLQVENTGDFDVNYNMLLDVKVSSGTGTEIADISEAMKYAVLSNTSYDEYKAALEGVAEGEEWDAIVEAAGENIGPVEAGTTTAAPNGALEKKTSEYFALAVHMDEEAGNEYQGHKIDINLKVEAKQKASESDSFGNNYDLNAEYAKKVNVFENSSFEVDIEGGFATNSKPWFYRNTGDIAFIEGMDAPDGVRYLSLSSAANGEFFVCQSEDDLVVEPGSEFTLTGWIKRVTDTGVPVIYVNFMNSADNSDHQQNYKETYENIPVGEWTQVSITGTVPEGVSRIRVHCKLVNDGAQAEPSVIYWDDVQLIMDKQDDRVQQWKDLLAAEEAVSQKVEVSNWKEPLEGESNILKNGEFNEAPGSSNYVWKAFKDLDVHKKSASSDTGYNPTTGKEEGTGLRLTANDTSPSTHSYMWTQFVDDIDAGSEYQLSYYYKLPEDGDYNYNFMSGFYVEFWNVPSNSVRYDSSQYISQIWVSPRSAVIADGEWHQYFASIIIPEGAKAVQVSPRMERAKSGNTIVYDNVQLYKTYDGGGTPYTQFGSNGIFTLDTDGTLFYKDMTETKFSLAVNAAKYPAYAGGKVTFEVFDGEELKWSAPDVAYTEGVASVNFDIATMTKINSQYWVKATAYDSTGAEVHVVTKDIYMFERPSDLSEDGKYVKFDDFVPVIGYHIETTSDFQKAQEEAGINVSVENAYSTVEDALKRLDKCQENGYKALLRLYSNMKPAAHSDNVGHTISLVSDPRIRNHEAFLGWIVMDEPFSHFTTEARDLMIQSYRLVREYDTESIVVFMEDKDFRYVETAELTDICFIDPYVYAKGAGILTSVSTAVDSSTVAGKTKPVWPVLQAFYWGESSLISPDDVRNNNWQALIAGADGLGYFSISDAGDITSIKGHSKPSDGYTAIWEIPEIGGVNGPELWGGLTDFHEKESEIAFDHFIKDKGTKLSEERNLETGYVYYSWATETGKVYAIVLNVKGADVDVAVPLKNADGSNMGEFTANVVSGKAVGEISGSGNLAVTLTGVEAVLFEIIAK